MLAKFFNNKSDARYVNKSLELIHDNVDIKYKEDTDLINPIFIVSSGLITPSVNYLWVENLGRYYFIKNVVFTQGMVEIECGVDVLTSFAVQLYRQNVIVNRNENLFDRYLQDEKIKVRNYDCVRTIQFPHGFESLNIILGVVGKTTNSNS